MTHLTQQAELPDLGVTVTLRPARLPDAYRATELVDVPAAPGTEMSTPQRVAYQMRLDDMATLLQVQDWGLTPPPDNLVALADELSPDDMAALRVAADELKKKKRGAKSASAPCAPLNAP